jgi:hypothetical protein
LVVLPPKQETGHNYQNTEMVLQPYQYSSFDLRKDTSIKTRPLSINDSL